MGFLAGFFFVNSTIYFININIGPRPRHDTKNKWKISGFVLDQNKKWFCYLTKKSGFVSRFFKQKVIEVLVEKGSIRTHSYPNHLKFCYSFIFLVNFSRVFQKTILEGNISRKLCTLNNSVILHSYKVYINQYQS